MFMSSPKNSATLVMPNPSPPEQLPMLLTSHLPVHTTSYVFVPDFLHAATVSARAYPFVFSHAHTFKHCPRDTCKRICSYQLLVRFSGGTLKIVSSRPFVKISEMLLTPLQPEETCCTYLNWLHGASFQS